MYTPSITMFIGPDILLAEDFKKLMLLLAPVNVAAKLACIRDTGSKYFYGDFSKISFLHISLFCFVNSIFSFKVALV